MAEADDVEFCDTPYAASFALFNQEKPAEAKVQSGSRTEQQPTPLDDETRHDANSDMSLKPADLPIPSQPKPAESESPIEPDASLAKAVNETLAKLQAANDIPLGNEQEWQALIAQVLEPMRSIQASWQSLEAERKALLKPAQNAQLAASAGFGIYAGRARGRGRGRGRGRYRGRT